MSFIVCLKEAWTEKRLRTLSIGGEVLPRGEGLFFYETNEPKIGARIKQLKSYFGFFKHPKQYKMIENLYPFQKAYNTQYNSHSALTCIDVFPKETTLTSARNIISLIV
jgi:hypothetical protein